MPSHLGTVRDLTVEEGRCAAELAALDLLAQNPAGTPAINGQFTNMSLDGTYRPSARSHGSIWEGRDMNRKAKLLPLVQSRSGLRRYAVSP